MRSTNYPLYLIQPIPELSPEQVIRLQLRGLQRNRERDNLGIAAAYAFASPANKMNTGPLERFARMLKNPLYRPMLNHRQAYFEPVKVENEDAQQRVILIDQENNPNVYLFTLSLQKYAPYWNCWMTDGVGREEIQRNR